MTNISSIEKEIASHRFTYNNTVKEFNTILDIIPSKLIGHICKIPRIDYLQFGDAITMIPKI